MMTTSFPKAFPVLETERLTLRDFDQNDSAGVFKNFSDSKVVEFLMEPITQIEAAEEFIDAFQEEFQAQKSITWAIALKEDNSFIGTCTCELLPGGHAELGFDIARSHWGQGYMSETLQAILNYGFKSLGLVKIKAHTLLLNWRTIKLLKRHHFQVDGVLRENTFVRNKVMDEIFFSLEKDAWIK